MMRDGGQSDVLPSVTFPTADISFFLPDVAAGAAAAATAGWAAAGGGDFDLALGLGLALPTSIITFLLILESIFGPDKAAVQCNQEARFFEKNQNTKRTCPSCSNTSSFSIRYCG